MKGFNLRQLCNSAALQSHVTRQTSYLRENLLFLIWKCDFIILLTILFMNTDYLSMHDKVTIMNIHEIMDFLLYKQFGEVIDKYRWIEFTVKAITNRRNANLKRVQNRTVPLESYKESPVQSSAYAVDGDENPLRRSLRSYEKSVLHNKTYSIKGESA